MTLVCQTTHTHYLSLSLSPSLSLSLILCSTCQTAQPTKGVRSCPRNVAKMLDGWLRSASSNPNSSLAQLYYVLIQDFGRFRRQPRNTSLHFAPLRSGSTFPALRFASFGSFCLFLLLLSSCPICFGACPRLKIEFNFRHAQINIFIMRGARVSCNFLIPTAPKKSQKKSQKTNKENTRRKRRHFPLGGGPPLGGRGVSQFFIYR